MQREIGDEVRLGSTVSLFGNIGLPSTIDRTASNSDDAKNQVKKIRELKSTRNYNADIARYFPGTLDMVFHGILEDINTKENVAQWNNLTFK